jgi:hypothetical protein
MMEQVNIAELKTQALDFAINSGPREWIAGIGLLVILILMFSLGASKRRRKKRARQLAPQLVLDAFHLAPLGRDAYFKILNTGQTAILHSLEVKGRNDVAIKNSVAGHQIVPGESYRVLLETQGAQKLTPAFSIEIGYMDQIGNVYRQAFSMKEQVAKTPKLVKLA